MATYQPYLGMWMFTNYCQKRNKFFKNYAFKDPYEFMLYDISENVSAREQSKDAKVISECNLSAQSDIVQCKHYLTSHVVYYIPENLANCLWYVDVDVRMEELKIPNSTFEINFPKGYIIPKTRKLMTPLLVSLNGPQTNFDFERKLGRDLYEKYKIKLTFPDYSEATTLFVQRSSPDIDLSKIKHMTPKEILEFVKRPEIWRYNNVSIPNEKKCISHTIRQFQIDQQNMFDRVSAYASMLFALKLLCYINLEHPDMEELLNPENNRVAANAEPPKVFLLGQSVEKDAYMRKGHIRCLRHERFRRDEEGKPRIVWVNESLVHRESKFSPKNPHKGSLDVFKALYK